MADDATNQPSPFDVGTIKNLVALMSRHDLSEIDLSIGDQRIRLRRGSRIAAPAVFPPATIPPAPPPQPAPSAAPAPAEKEKPTRQLIEIKSETPGTFYAKPDPKAPQPFVTVGSQIKPDTVVCIIMAMKIQNEITAGCTGVIREVLVKDEEAVDYGQVLFRVDPTG